MKKILVFAVLAMFSLILLGSVFAIAENSERNGMSNDSENESLKDQREQLKQEAENLREQSKDLREQLRENEKNLREQIREMNKSEREYEHEGRNISIESLNDSQLEIIAGKINAKTGLNLTVEDLKNGTLGSILRTHLSNGREAEIKFMPDKASERAREVMGAKCEERNCTLELKEVGKGNETRLAYEIKTDKDAKFLFLINVKKQFSANIDAETGNVTDVRGPWWSFLAKDQ
ncbi:MAG: hypothetical protein WCK90_01555 [archaeon]